MKNALLVIVFLLALYAFVTIIEGLLKGLEQTPTWAFLLLGGALIIFFAYKNHK